MPHRQPVEVAPTTLPTIQPLRDIYGDRIFSAIESLIEAGRAMVMETQSNDPWLAPALLTYCQEITCEAILFRDHSTNAIRPDNVTMRIRNPEDQAALERLDLAVEAQWIAMERSEIVGVGRILALQSTLP